MEEKFFELLKKGMVRPSQIDDYIDRWHDDPKAPRSVLTYLGMTRKQYAEFVENDYDVLQKYYNTAPARKVASKK